MTAIFDPLYADNTIRSQQLHPRAPHLLSTAPTLKLPYTKQVPSLSNAFFSLLCSLEEAVPTKEGGNEADPRDSLLHQMLQKLVKGEGETKRADRCRIRLISAEERKLEEQRTQAEAKRKRILEAQMSLSQSLVVRLVREIVESEQGTRDLFEELLRMYITPLGSVPSYAKYGFSLRFIYFLLNVVYGTSFNGGK